MPRYSSPQRNSSGPQNDLIEKEAQADSLNNSMPDPLSMGNSAIQDMLFSGDPIEIPLWNGKQNMSLVIGSDQKNEDLPENDQNQNQDDLDSSVISTSKERKQRELEEMMKRMQGSDISLVDEEDAEAGGEADKEDDEESEGQTGRSEGPCGRDKIGGGCPESCRGGGRTCR